MSVHPGKLLRSLVSRGGCLCLPGTFNGLCARMAKDAGFEGCYISGAAVAAAQGLPDIGIASLESFTRVIGDVTSASGLPCLADADTGFGEIESIRRVVFEYNRAGAAGFHIEDQTFPKRCGHLDGKHLITADEMCGQITRAVSASKFFSEGNFIVCARTDANAVEGLDAAVDRSFQYAKAGADMIFPEGLTSEEEFKVFASSLRTRLGVTSCTQPPYLLANMTEFGKTPPMDISTFEALGYNCVIFPVSTLRCAMKGVHEFLTRLKATGGAASSLDLMYSRQELYKSLGYTPGKEYVFPGRDD